MLVTGGLLNRASPNTLTTATTQLYDPVSNTWSAAMPAAQPRYSFALVALPGGQLVMAGGARDYDDSWTDASFVREIELFDPVSAAWQTIGSLPEPRAELAALWLPGSRVWLAGGRAISTFWATTWIVAVPAFAAP